MPLYKYATKERIDILEGGMIRFTQPIAFNDPFELKPHINSLCSTEETHKVIEDNIEQIIKNEYERLPLEIRNSITAEDLKDSFYQQGLHNQLAEMLSCLPPAIESSIHTALNSKIGILCLSESEEPDNLLMWSHYADSHEGFAIEFDPAHSYFDQRRSNSDDLRYLTKVKYQSDRPKLEFNTIDNFGEFLVKSIQWEYEQEWRMLTDLDSANKVIERNDHHVYLFDLPFSAIKSITLGCKSSSELKQKVKAIVSSSTELQHITLYELYEDRGTYKLNKARLDEPPVTTENYPDDLLKMMSERIQGL